MGVLKVSEKPGIEVAMVLRMLADWCDASARGGIDDPDPFQNGRNTTLFEMRNFIWQLYFDRVGSRMSGGYPCDHCGNRAMEDWDVERLTKQLVRLEGEKLAKVGAEVERQIAEMKAGGIIENGLDKIRAILAENP